MIVKFENCVHSCVNPVPVTKNKLWCGFLIRFCYPHGFGVRDYGGKEFKIRDGARASDYLFGRSYYYVIFQRLTMGVC